MSRGKNATTSGPEYIYEVHHKPTGSYAKTVAETPEAACKSLGWELADCEVEQIGEIVKSGGYPITHPRWRAPDFESGDFEQPLREPLMEAGAALKLYEIQNHKEGLTVQVIARNRIFAMALTGWHVRDCTITELGPWEDTDG